MAGGGAAPERGFVRGPHIAVALALLRPGRALVVLVRAPQLLVADAARLGAVEVPIRGSLAVVRLCPISAAPAGDQRIHVVWVVDAAAVPGPRWAIAAVGSDGRRVNQTGAGRGLCDPAGSHLASLHALLHVPHETGQ